MRRRFLCRILLRGPIIGGFTECSVDPPIVPRGKGSDTEAAPEIIADIAVGPRICDLGRIVAIPAILTPGVENHLLPAVVRIKRRDDTAGGIIEQDRADPDLLRELETVGRREEGLIFP